MEMTWRKSFWWMRPPEMDLPCSGSETQGPLSLPALHGGIHGLILSSGDQWLLLKHIYSGMKWVFLVPR